MKIKPEKLLPIASMALGLIGMVVNNAIQENDKKKLKEEIVQDLLKKKD